MASLPPKYRIPLYPSFSQGLASPWRSGEKTRSQGVFDKGKVLWTMNARSALQMGLQAMRLKPGDEVLVPAYHCPVMIYPIVQQELVPVYYQIKEDCGIHLDNLRSKITQRTKAVIAIHYFGFPTPLSDLKATCEEYNLYLIEDCAHAFFGSWPNQEIGGVGDISIASLYKFFPVIDGGGIRINNNALRRTCCTQKNPSLFTQLKSMINSLESRNTGNNKKGVIPSVLRLKETLWRFVKRRKSTPESIEPTEIINSAVTDADSPFTANLVASTYSQEKTPIFTRLVYRFSSKHELMTRRRKNYLYLHSALRKLGYTPLFESLPDGVIPYNLPIVDSDAELIAKKLRNAGIAVARFGEFYWDERDRTTCPISNRYSKHCFQLPIHQSLTPQNLHHIVDTLRR